MTSDEYRAAIARLRLSQVQAGAFLGKGERTSRRWAAKGCPDWEIVQRLRLLARLDLSDADRDAVRGLDFLALLVRFGISPVRAEEMTREPFEFDCTP